MNYSNNNSIIIAITLIITTITLNMAAYLKSIEGTIHTIPSDLVKHFPLFDGFDTTPECPMPSDTLSDKDITEMVDILTRIGAVQVMKKELSNMERTEENKGELDELERCKQVASDLLEKHFDDVSLEELAQKMIKTDFMGCEPLLELLKKKMLQNLIPQLDEMPDLTQEERWDIYRRYPELIKADPDFIRKNPVTGEFDPTYPRPLNYVGPSEGTTSTSTSSTTTSSSTSSTDSVSEDQMQVVDETTTNPVVKRARTD
jgi:hypothetical protein